MPTDPTPDLALVELVAEALGTRRNGPASDGRGWFRTAADRVDCYADATVVLSALAAAGRLQDAGAVIEWGWLSADTVRVYASLSEAAARRAASRSGARKTMRREVGPWLPAPDTEQGELT